MRTTAMTTASKVVSKVVSKVAMSNTGMTGRNILTSEELESLRLIVDTFESQVRREAQKPQYGGLSNKQRAELCIQLSKLMEIKRKLKLMKGRP